MFVIFETGIKVLKQMNEENNQKEINKVAIQALKEGKEKETLQVIELMRSKGSVAVLPHLLNVLNNAPSDTVVDAIFDLLRDIKDQPAVPHIVSTIKETNDPLIRRRLTTACWESGLDFSQYISVFADLLIEQDFTIAIEAFTVIEESVQNQPGKEYDKAIAKLEASMKRTKSSEKQALIKETLKLLVR